MRILFHPRLIFDILPLHSSMRLGMYIRLFILMKYFFDLENHLALHKEKILKNSSSYIDENMIKTKEEDEKKVLAKESIE